MSLVFIDLRGVELVFHQLDELILAGRLIVLGGLVLSVLADREVEREFPAGHLVERLREQCRVLRLLGELAVERRRGRELDRQPVLVELRRMRLAEHRSRRDRLLFDGRQYRPLPSLLELRKLNRRRLARRLRLRLRSRNRTCRSARRRDVARWAT